MTTLSTHSTVLLARPGFPLQQLADSCSLVQELQPRRQQALGVVGVTIVESTATTTTVIATAEGAGIGTTTIFVGIEGAEAATVTTTLVGITGTEAAIGSTVTATGIGIGIPASTELAVVGGLEYTMPYLGVGGYNVLYTSNAAWTMGMNYTWLEGIVASGESVLLYPGGGVTALEVQYLLGHWYIRVGNLLMPRF